MCVPLSKGTGVGNLQIAMGFEKNKNPQMYEGNCVEINDFKVDLRFKVFII
jgi:hypothetical protein